MTEYIDIDKNVIVYDTRGRRCEVTVRHILEKNHGEYEVDDVVPAVRGKWEYNGPDENVPYCSNCMLPSEEETRFCAGCGADMRETNDEKERDGRDG